MQQQGRRLNDYDKIEQLRERGYELEHRIMTDLFSQNRIIASTLIGAGSPLLEQMHFSTLFIAAAAQATAPACMVAICNANRSVMAGRSGPRGGPERGAAGGRRRARGG